MAVKTEKVIKIPWAPQPRQKELLKATGVYWDPAHKPITRLIGYGGAAFGGKTDGQLGLAIAAAFAFKGCRVGLFRRMFTELEGPDGPIERSVELLAGISEYNKTAHRHLFPNGSRLYFHHCQNESDRTNYQSQAWDILLFDEATHFTWPIVDYLLTRNRATVKNPLLTPFCVMTTNPGNVGHGWFTDLFDTLNEMGPHRQIKHRRSPNGKFEDTYFIPAFLEDNPIGLARDPDYGTRLEQRSDDVARALRWGDWRIFQGQAFPTWGDRHIVPDFPIPDWWPKWRAVDYGQDHPFVCGWFTSNPEKRKVYIYRAVIRSGLTDTQQAQLIKDMTPPTEMITVTYASPDMWSQKTKDESWFTTVDEYADRGVILTKANNDRLAGKRAIDRMIADAEDGTPRLGVFRSYSGAAQCMSRLVRDPARPEDVAKVNGDDFYDMLRYGMTNTMQPGSQKDEEQSEQQKTQLETELDLIMKSM